MAAPPPVSRGAVLLAVVLGSGIVFLDGTIVNVALETIGRDLPSAVVGRLEGLTYVTGGYLAVLAAFLIPAGALSDAYGRRRVFGMGLVGFGATSLACGLAPTMEVLIVCRLFQGAAGAFLVPGALSIITATFSGEERGRAIGVWAAATSALTTLGPLVGGLLIQALSWRAAFLVNLPLVLVALLALRRVPESRDEQTSERIDWLGAFVAIVAVGGLAFGATRGQQQHWQDPVAFAALAVGAVALVAFPILMAVRPNPLVPLDLFRRRTFAVVNLSTLVIYGALYVSLTFQSLFLQGTLGYTPLAAGVLGLPSGILLAVLSTPIGRQAGRIGARPFLVAGPLLMSAGLFWLARIPADSTRLGGAAERSREPGSAARLRGRRPAGKPPLRRRPGPARGAADHRPHGLRARAPSRPRVGHQQRDLTGRGAPRERCPLHRDHGHLRPGGRRGRPRPGPDGGRGTRARPARPAAGRDLARAGRRDRGRLDERVPPGHGRGRRDARGRGGGEPPRPRARAPGSGGRGRCDQRARPRREPPSAGAGRPPAARPNEPRGARSGAAPRPGTPPGRDRGGPRSRPPNGPPWPPSRGRRWSP